MRVVISAHNVVDYPLGGGHFWVYLQYADGLRRLGCDVWWLEDVRSDADPAARQHLMQTLVSRLAEYGLGGKGIFYAGQEFLNAPSLEVRRIFRDADLLLNFHQRIAPWVLELFRRTALVDIDPGLLQYWMSSGDLDVEPHDLYLTTGETVGTPQARFSDCGLTWIRIRPPVSLELWPARAGPDDAACTTVSGWWGNDEWLSFDGVPCDNNKRAAFLRFLDLPAATTVPLELALMLDLDEPHDVHDKRLLLQKGWRVRHSHDVAGTPEKYQRYIQSSRGEFSCAKASCMRFANAWVSDRTLCYLASGRPVVVEDTGPSTILPNGLGMFRFSTVDEAAAALETVQADYEKHSAAARELALEFDAKRVCETILDRCAGTLAGTRR
ncbi:MAG: glycosyltransferase family 1 protein [Candidatus Eremiobacteraeota bacterium]|nr:glycosyltransferase family 1 protein [Candidatus Eremiobacteraeota bacterium]